MTENRGPVTRSMTADMSEGVTDGKYKKVINDRGGIVETVFYADRVDLNDWYYGIHEEPHKIDPGTGRPIRTPNFVPTPPVR